MQATRYHQILCSLFYVMTAKKIIKKPKYYTVDNKDRVLFFATQIEAAQHHKHDTPTSWSLNRIPPKLLQ